MDPKSARAAKGGGPAFPGCIRVNKKLQRHSGMDLRDWFAGRALTGILSGGFADTIPHDDVSGGEAAASYAYQYADAMLSVRQRRSGLQHDIGNPMTAAPQDVLADLDRAWRRFDGRAHRDDDRVVSSWDSFLALCDAMKALAALRAHSEPRSNG